MLKQKRQIIFFQENGWPLAANILGFSTPRCALPLGKFSAKSARARPKAPLWQKCYRQIPQHYSAPFGSIKSRKPMKLPLFEFLSSRAIDWDHCHRCESCWSWYIQHFVRASQKKTRADLTQRRNWASKSWPIRIGLVLLSYQGVGEHVGQISAQSVRQFSSF